MITPVEQAKSMFLNMPEEVFDGFLAPLISDIGWPFHSVYLPLDNTHWFSILYPLTLPDFCELKWVRHIFTLDDGLLYGADLPDVSYEEMLRFYEEKRYDIKVGNGLFIPAEFHALETVINTLLARKWTLLVAGDCAGHFICCDHPVRLRWSDPADENFFPPGHAVAGTEIVFPLSKELVLIGTFEGSQKKIIADRKVIAMVNTVIIEGSDRHIFSPINEFDFFSTDGMILSSSNVLRHFKRIDHKKPSRKR